MGPRGLDDKRRDLVSVVVPVYNESAVIEQCHERLCASLAKLDGFDFELVFVDDGSADDSYDQLRALAQSEPRTRVIKLSRNFGHQIAITAGLDHARGDCVVVIDADLQDPPEVIAAMIEKWREGYDVVYGERITREGETRLKLLSASLFYRLLRSMVGIDIPANVGDFRLMSRRAADELKGLRERERYVRGLVSWIGFKQTGVQYRRHSRAAGSTKYPYRKMIKFAVDGITSFSTLPLKLASWLGYAASALAFAYLVSVFVQKLMGNTVQGWATIMVALLFLGGVQLISMGIIGEYIGRISNEVKGRPLYVIDQRLGGPAKDPEPPHPVAGGSAE